MLNISSIMFQTQLPIKRANFNSIPFKANDQGDKLDKTPDKPQNTMVSKAPVPAKRQLTPAHFIKGRLAEYRSVAESLKPNLANIKASGKLVEQFTLAIKDELGGKYPEAEQKYRQLLIDAGKRQIIAEAIKGIVRSLIQQGDINDTFTQQSCDIKAYEELSKVTNSAEKVISDNDMMDLGSAHAYMMDDKLISIEKAWEIDQRFIPKEDPKATKKDETK